MKTFNETNSSNDSRDAERGEHGDGAGRDCVTQPFTITSCVANFQHGMTDQTMTADIVGSDEFLGGM